MNLRIWPFIYLWLGCFLYDWIYHRDLAIKVMDRVTTAMACITEWNQSRRLSLGFPPGILP